ncbi:hypothetical protein [Methanothermococcus okinawensis]|uniref:hypothetical protein n=1 Tax=Methanothermococcus okinawensis TaxID=155863 RepID=UPI00064ECFF5|nr:hypothetical protein [Methanothermococcus okinawensis]
MNYDSLLKIYASSYEHVKVDEIKAMPMIKLKDVREFLKFASKYKAKIICEYDGNNGDNNTANKYDNNINKGNKDATNKQDIKDSGMFFITLNGAIYWIPNKGYKSLYDLFDGVEKGFEFGEDYYRYKELGFSNAKEYFEFKESGFKDKDDYKNAKKLGFIGALNKLKKEGLAYDDLLSGCKYITCYTEEGYRDEYRICSDADLYYYAIEEGFKDFKELFNALLLEFGNVEIYRDALDNGFQNAEEYYNCLERGFKNIEEYNKAKKLGVCSKSSYELYLKLKGIMSEYRLATFEEALLYDIILDIPFGSEITIDEIWDKLKNDKRIELTPEEKLQVMAGHKEKDKIINYTQKWFSKRFDNKEDLKKYMLNDEFINSMLNYDLDKYNFKKTCPVILSKRYIIIDGINIAQNIKDDTIFKYIHRTINMAKKIGFENIIFVVDNSDPSIPKTYYH